MNFKRVASAVCALALIAGMVAAPAQGIIPAVQPVITASAEETIVPEDLELTVSVIDNNGTKKLIGKSRYGKVDDKYKTSMIEASVDDVSQFVFDFSLPEVSGDYHVKVDAYFFVEIVMKNGFNGAVNWAPEIEDHFIHLTDEEPVYTMTRNNTSTSDVEALRFTAYYDNFIVENYTPADPAPVDPAPAKKSLSKAKVKAANKTYTGKALTPKVTVTLDGKTLSKGTDYTAAYKNNKNCGKATVTVTGKGSYTGSKSGSFVIKPGKVTAKKATSPKKQQVKVIWTKAKGGVTGYQVQVALDKKFKKSVKTYTVKKAATTSKTVKKLKSKKTYYVRVRAYKTVGLKKYTGKWSAVKSVKCK